MGIALYERARTREIEIGHIRGRWTYLGEAAGTAFRGVGVIGRLERLDYWDGEE